MSTNLDPISIKKILPVNISPTKEENTSNTVEMNDSKLQGIPSQLAEAQRLASIVARPDLLTAGASLPPTDLLPCGTLDPISIKSSDLKTYGNVVVIITGPFAGGKDTVAKSLLEDSSLKISKAILYTTRLQGKGEINGVDYKFLNRDQFIENRKNNQFLSWNELEPGFYGVGLSDTKISLESGKDVIAVVGPTVATPLKKGLTIANIPYIEIFISPVSKEILAQPSGVDLAIENLKERIRKRNRGGTDETKLDLLMQRSREWLSEPQKFQHIVENPDGELDTAVSSIKKLIETKKSEKPTQDPASLEFEKTGSINDEFFKLHSLKSNGNTAVIISGPSGAGKGTILEKAFKDDSIKLAKAINSTSRKPRPNEKNGVDYHFFSREEFENKIKSNELLQWLVGTNDNYYGSSEKEVQEIFDSGKDAVIDVDIKGANFFRYVLKRLGVSVADIFISPVPKDMLKDPSGIDNAKKILRERISKRGSGETEMQIEDRVNKATEFLNAANSFTHIIENTDGKLDEAVNEFIKIIKDKKATL